MSFVSSFAELLNPLAVLMSQPSFATFQILIYGWLFARRRTVTGMIQAADALQIKHHSAFHRFFSTARWCRDQMGLLIFDLVSLLTGDRIFLTLDDTLSRKRGLKVYGAGMHHDPMISTRKKAQLNYGHSWVVLAVVIPCPLRSGRFFSLPILVRLYLNKKSAQKEGKAYRTRPELGVELIQLLARHAPHSRFHLLADSAYGGESVLGHLPEQFDMTSRLPLDARLYRLPPERKPGTNGRPRKRGDRLPNPGEMLSRRARRVTLSIYGRRDRARLVEGQGCWYCLPGLLLSIVAVEPLSGGRKAQAFYSTVGGAGGIEIVSWYAMRWSCEVTFRDAKQNLGFEQPQGWTESAVQRTAPMALYLYSLVVYWFVTTGYRSYQASERPWYGKKVHPSFAEMLATLKRQHLQLEVSEQVQKHQSSENLQNIHEKLIRLAT